MSTYSPQKAGKKSWIVWFFAVLFYFYEFMIQVSPGVMAQDLMRDFNIHATDLGNLSAYYFYSYASMQLVVGILLDSWGPRKLLSASSILCAVGCYFFSHSDGLMQAELSRLLIGAGSACAVISSFKLATSWFPPHYFGIMTGLTVMIGMLGAIFGEAPLAWVVQLFGWRQAMLGFSVGGIVLSILIWSIVRDVPETAKNQVFSKKISIIDNISAILTCKQTWLASIYGGLMFAPTTALGALWGVSWMCTYYSLDRSTAAHIISFLFLGWAVGSPLSGVLTNYFGRCKVTMQGGTIVSFVVICLLIFINSWSITSLNLLWFSFGLASSGFLPFMTIIRKQHSYQTAGTAMGFGNGMNMVGGALLQPIIGLFLDKSWDGTMIGGVRSYSPQGYTNALIIVPILIAISYVILLMIKEEDQEKVINVNNQPKLQQTFAKNTFKKGAKMVKNFIILLTFGLCLMISTNAAELYTSTASQEEPYKLYAVVKKGISFSQTLQIVGEHAFNLGCKSERSQLKQMPYISQDGTVYEAISEYPFIVVTNTQGKIDSLRTSISSLPAISYSQAVSSEGFCVLGKLSTLQPLMKSFSLLRKPTIPIEDEPLDNLSTSSLYFAFDNTLEEGTAANSFAHTAIGLGSTRPREDITTSFNICRGSSENLTELWQEIRQTGTIPHVTFLDTMLLGTAEQQIHATSERPTADLRILSMSFYIPADLITTRLLPLLKRLSKLR